MDRTEFLKAMKDIPSPALAKGGPGGGFLSAFSLPFRAAPAASVADGLMANPPARRGRLLYKLLVIFLGLSIVPLMWAGFVLIRVGDNYIQKESRGVKMGIAQKVAGNVAGYLENVKNILQVV